MTDQVTSAARSTLPTIPSHESSAMKVGNRVWNTWHGILRFGTIISKRKDDDGWTYFTVDWESDEAYRDRMSHRRGLAGGQEFSLEEYRADQIHPEPQKTTQRGSLA